jgi:Tetratricopeptide repeat/AAA ATPase domain
MISTTRWQQLTPPEFEELAIEHVRDIYPECSWCCTSLSRDGGKDAVGEVLNLRDEIAEIYWMEAKHHPANRSIGKYTLDTHLVSAFFSRNVKRLHVVTSGLLSGNFIHRADSFSKEHGFIFAYSDQEAVEAWLASRRDVVEKYFGRAASDVLLALENARNSSHSVFARAHLLADNDGLNSSAVPVPHLLPGKKFRLAVSVSIAAKISHQSLPLRLKWDVPPQRVALLTPVDVSAGDVLTFDPLKVPIVSIPFRLLSFSRDRLPSPVIYSSDGEELASPELGGTKELPRLTSPFVGGVARQELLGLKRLLREGVSLGRPQLVVCRGRAGSGKTRLAEELRDDAQLLGFTVRSVELTSTPSSQEERWRLLFRWLFGLEHNPFELPEEEVISTRLARLNIGSDDGKVFETALRAFLVSGVYTEEFFNLDLPTGRRLADAVRSALGGRFERPVLLHIDDAHHLSRRQLRPLYLLRHLIETSDSLPLCLIVTARNDETVRDNSFEHFVDALELTAFLGFRVIDLPDMTVEDARELVVTTLRWPELLAQESKTLALIVERAGTNPFFLMQTLDHLAVDHETVAFGYGDGYFLIDIPAFKRALRELPKSVRDILSQRFAGLLRRGEDRLLMALAAISIIGRRAPKRIVSRALSQPVSAGDVGRLLSLGYLADASGQHLELAHDLLAEALRGRPEARKVASSLASSIRAKADRALTEEQRAAVYYAAGARYYRDSWEITRRIVEKRSRRQEYLSLPPFFERLERIASASKGMTFDADLTWLAAIAEQHCGNTHAALLRFLKIKEIAEEELPDNAERYIDSLIEVGNQHLLRAEPTSALRNIAAALEVLGDPELELPPKTRLWLTALAHNRYGAVLHLLERHGEALEHFDSALRAAAAEPPNDYLLSHTHWNLASLLRFGDPEGALDHFRKARRVWREKLRERERLRVMLDCSEAYSACLNQNTSLARSRLRAVAADASEKGYLFQACDALLCLSACSLAAEEWQDAKRTLLRALDFTVAAENLRSRIFITHYLSVCAHMLGAELECRDWCWQAVLALSDAAFDGTELQRCLHYNESVATGRAPQNVVGATEDVWNPTRRAGMLRWYLFERA